MVYQHFPNFKLKKLLNCFSENSKYVITFDWFYDPPPPSSPTTIKLFTGWKMHMNMLSNVRKKRVKYFTDRIGLC